MEESFRFTFEGGKVLEIGPSSITVSEKKGKRSQTIKLSVTPEISKRIAAKMNEMAGGAPQSPPQFRGSKDGVLLSGEPVFPTRDAMADEAEMVKAQALKRMGQSKNKAALDDTPVLS